MQSEIQERILQLMRKHGIQNVDYSNAQGTISLSLSTGDQKTIRAPIAGHFLQHHPMEGENRSGLARVRKGDIIAYLKIGPLLRPVLAEENCHTIFAKVVDGTLVSYADPLFDYS